MSGIQVVEFISVLLGIIMLVFCRRIADFTRSFYGFFGINLSEWTTIIGVVIAGIGFIYIGLTN